MGGLGVLIAVAIYVAIAFKVVIATRSKKARYALIAIFALIPAADALVGRVYTKYLCATEGGLKVYRTVQNASGFLIAEGTDGHWVKVYGYRFVEGGRSEPNLVDRFERLNGEIKVETKVKPKSIYRFRFVGGREGDIIYRNQATVDVITTGELLATYTSFYFRGGWAERFLANFTDAGPGTEVRCQVWQPEILKEKSITTSLLPTTQSESK